VLGAEFPMFISRYRVQLCMLKYAIMWDYIPVMDTSMDTSRHLVKGWWPKVHAGVWSPRRQSKEPP
jgi:hypothetical protein